MKSPEDHIVKVAKALSDKTRVKLLQDIARWGSISCGDAITIAGLSQPTVSHHIKVLVDAGLLSSKKKGRHVMITVNKEALDDFSALVVVSAKR